MIETEKGLDELYKGSKIKPGVFELYLEQYRKEGLWQYSVWELGGKGFTQDRICRDRRGIIL